MINLIPPHARKQVQFEYWVRVFSVWLLVIAVALAMVLVFLLPAYVLINSQLSAYQETYKQASEQDASYKELEAAVRTANAKAQQLLVGSDRLHFTEVLTEIETLAGAAVSIESVDMDRTDLGTIDALQVRGTAATRAALAAYRDAIEEQALFESAVLPISNLAKDRDVPFTITVTVATEI